jgi:hypothetical protein
MGFFLFVCTHYFNVSISFPQAEVLLADLASLIRTFNFFRVFNLLTNSDTWWRLFLELVMRTKLYISTLLYFFFTSFYHNTQVIFIFPFQCAWIFGRYKIVVNTIHSYSIIMSCPVPESLLLDNPGITFSLQAYMI